MPERNSVKFARGGVDGGQVRANFNCNCKVQLTEVDLIVFGVSQVLRVHVERRDVPVRRHLTVVTRGERRHIDAVIARAEDLFRIDAPTVGTGIICCVLLQRDHHLTIFGPRGIVDAREVFVPDLRVEIVELVDVVVRPSLRIEGVARLVADLRGGVEGLPVPVFTVVAPLRLGALNALRGVSVARDFCRVL